LKEIDLDRREPAEDTDHDFNLAAFGVDFGDSSREIPERPVDDLNRIPDIEGDLDLVFRGLDSVGSRANSVYLLDRDGNGLAAGGEEIRHAGGAGYQGLRFLGYLHIHEDIAREEFALNSAPLALPHLDDILGGDQYLGDLILQTLLASGGLEIALGLLLMPGERMNDIPAVHLTHYPLNNEEEQPIDRTDENQKEYTRDNNRNGKPDKLILAWPSHLLEFLDRLTNKSLQFFEHLSNPALNG